MHSHAIAIKKIEVTSVAIISFQHLGLLALWMLLLSPLAFQACLGGWQYVRDPLFLFNVGTSLLWMVLAHCAVQRTVLLHLLLIPLYMTTVADLFLLTSFGARLSSGYVSIALTNNADTFEFFSAYGKPAVIALLSFILIYVPGLCSIQRIRHVKSPRLAALAAAMLVTVYGAVIANSVRQGTSVNLALLDLAAHESSAPMGALFQTALALKLHADNTELRTHRTGYSFGASKVPSPGDEVYVWVIGESARPANWSLFGYTRDTSPKLRAMSGIISFPQMLTTAPHTSVAVPSMLSLEPITNWPAVLARKSIVGAFNEAGFQTYWLSAQDADSWSGAIPQVAAEAQHRSYYNNGYDGALLAEFRKILQDTPRSNNKKLFIVLHTKGSHFDYERRYPAQFARFNTLHGTRRDKLVDTYDNSILYTDWFLSEVIATLVKRNTLGALIYASDHGENLLDDERQIFGHAQGTQYDLSTASFMWFSNELGEHHPDWLINAHRHAQSALSLSNLSHSMLELAGIHAHSIDPNMSIFSTTFEEHLRSYIVREELHHE